MADEMTTEEYLAIRKKAALEIDPRTAEIEWHASIVDPYGVPSEISDECWQLDFARAKSVPERRVCRKYVGPNTLLKICFTAAKSTRRPHTQCCIFSI